MDDAIINACNTAQAIINNVARVIVGKREVIERAIVALISKGHLLIEDAPGVGKTMLSRGLAKSIDCTFKRIQFTPDMLPGDITGVSIYNQSTRNFEFHPGPIMAQLVLADEINRATPKVQSALLECMEERQITVDGTTHTMPTPFHILATQNPIEQEGTYPLPEAQVDRFFFKLKVTYPTTDQLAEIIDKTTEDYQPNMKKVVDSASILLMKGMVRQVPIASHVKSYAIRIVLASHPNENDAVEKIRKYVRYGASPRGVQSLVMAGKVRALIQGRYNVSFEDIREVAKPALRHRILLNLRGEAEGIDTDDIIEDIVKAVPEKE